MTRPASIVIHIDSLLHNFNRVRELAPKSKVISMVKADAYGHGIVRISQALKDSDAFAVASLDEAKKIRQAGIQQPLILTAGFFSLDELIEINNLDCDIVLHCVEQAKALCSANLKKQLTVWLKINTGMNRLGVMPNEVTDTYQLLKRCKNVKDIKLITHFSDADIPSLPKTNQQIKLFNETVKDLESERSLANSAAIIAFPKSHADYVRPGLMLYGASPIIGKTAKEFDLKPVMTVTSEIIAIRHQKKGDQIGYGSTFTCPKAMPVGIVAMGYGDGYPWHLPHGSVVLINGVESPVVGRVSMDFLSVDLRQLPHAKVGDRVVLWGEGLPVERVASFAETISYDLLCGIGRRVK